MSPLQHDLPRFVGNQAALSLDDRRIRAAQHHVNLRRQGQRVAFARILHADGPARGLRRAELHTRVRSSVARISVENQIAGFQVNRIFQRLGYGLIGTGQPAGICHQVNLHIALGRDVAAARVVGEIVAVDLVVAGRIAAVENDVDVVQLGAVAHNKAFEAAGLDGEKCASTVGLGVLKSAGRLLDFVPDLVGNFLEHVTRPRTRIEIHPRHRHREHDGSHRQHASQTIDRKRHLGSV